MEMTMHYQRFEELGIAPDEYSLSAAIIHALNGTIPPSARVMPEQPDRTGPPKRNHNKPKGSAPRTFASRYVGVTVHRGRWVGLLGARGTRQGPRRERTPEGELGAAWDRAIALGRPGVEERPAAQVAATEPVVSQPSARGPHTRALGGRRIA